MNRFVVWTDLNDRLAGGGWALRVFLALLETLTAGCMLLFMLAFVEKIFTLVMYAVFSLIEFAAPRSAQHRRWRFEAIEVSVKEFADPNAASSLPVVTIQLPMYKESFQVAAGAINSACSMQWPRSRLQVMVADDGHSEETTALLQELAARWRSKGVDCALYQREERTGFKAGALLHHHASVRGEYIAIFDADFKPFDDFLLQTVPYLTCNSVSDPLGLSASVGPLAFAQIPLKRKLSACTTQTPTYPACLPVRVESRICARAMDVLQQWSVDLHLLR